MLTLALIQKTQNFFDYCEKSLENQEILVVTPNPTTADLARRRFDQVSNSVECLTISKFIQNSYDEIFGEDKFENYKSKSELIILLGAIWKKVKKEKNIVDFHRAFNLFTEFRSFSLSDLVLETVLENYEKDLADSVLWFHRFVGELEIFDEHGSYFQLAERLREGDLPPLFLQDQHIIFYGFDYMTASQVDLLKALSLRNEIYIPFYKNAYEKSIGTDWVKWFDEHNRTIVDLNKNETLINELDCYFFTKHYLGKYLMEVPEIDEVQDIFLGSKNLSREQYQEIPLNNLKVKFPVEIFNEKYNLLQKELEDLIGDDEFPVYDLVNLIQEKIVNFSKLEDYPGVKVCTQLLKTINSWSDLSSENESIDIFDFSILSETTLLDLPRLNMANLSQDSSITLRGFSELEEVKEHKVIWAINSNHDGFQFSGANYSENVEKYLVSIGPIRRSNLEAIVFEEKVKEFISDNKVTLLLEDLLLEENSNINEVFSSYVISRKDLNLKKRLGPTYLTIDKGSQPLKKLSASKLQRYSDCPQKYYFHYVKNYQTDIFLETELNALEIGQIEHKVIETYCLKNSEYDENIHEKIIRKVLESYLKDKKLKETHSIFLEVKSYTASIVSSLLQMREELGLELQFELPFSMEKNGISYNGSIDFFAKKGDQYYIFDFKRSNSSFGSFTSLLEFEPLQLWFYLSRMIETKAISSVKNLNFGYVDLSNIENSIFLGDSRDELGEIKNYIPQSKSKVIEDLEEKLQEYSEFEMELIEKMNNDTTFSPSPRNVRACNFCSFNKVCPRGER